MIVTTYQPNPFARIEAALFTEETAEDIQRWSGNDVQMRITRRSNEGWDIWAWQVHTSEGWVDMPFGHYTVKGVNGEFYPVDPDVFEQRWVIAGTPDPRLDGSREEPSDVTSYIPPHHQV